MTSITKNYTDVDGKYTTYRCPENAEPTLGRAVRIGNNVTFGKNIIIGELVHIYDDVSIGDDSILEDFVSVYDKVSI